MSSRLIDPRKHIERGTDEAHGVLTARELERQIDTGQKIDAQSDRTQRFIVFETIEMHCPNPPANATTTMNWLIAASASAIQLTNINPDVSQQCRVVSLRIMTNASVTAGTITPLLSVYEAGWTDYLMDECQLNATESGGKSAVFDWPVAIQLAKNALWTVALVTSAGYLPITNDYKVLISFGFEQWI